MSGVRSRRFYVREFGDEAHCRPRVGGPEQLTVDTVAHLPVPGPGELLVDVGAAAVNYLDVYQRKGLRKLPSPFTPGLERVGRVRSLGGGGMTAQAQSAWGGAWRGSMCLGRTLTRSSCPQRKPSSC